MVTLAISRLLLDYSLVADHVQRALQGGRSTVQNTIQRRRRRRHPTVVEITIVAVVTIGLASALLASGGCKSNASASSVRHNPKVIASAPAHMNMEVLMGELASVETTAPVSTASTDTASADTSEATVAGADGAPGADGAAGADGPAGPTGSAGADGPAGPTGSAGADGPAGPRGSTGATGSVGATGPAGDGLTPVAGGGYKVVSPDGHSYSIQVTDDGIVFSGPNDTRQVWTSADRFASLVP